VADLVADGYTNDEIAEMLGIAPRTVKSHIDVIKQKLGIKYRRQIGRMLRTLEGWNENT
jgi:DNA-binding NarL/FixJ family response regulator